MILFKRQRITREWLQTLPSGSTDQIIVTVAAQKPLLTDSHFIRCKASGRCLLVSDGAISHPDHTTVEFTERQGLCLPFQVTGELQSMDKSICVSLADYVDEQLLLFYNCSSDLTIINHKRFTIFTHAWDKATTPANIKEGFHVTEIYRFILSTIPSEAFAPSLATQNKDLQSPLLWSRLRFQLSVSCLAMGLGMIPLHLIYLSQMQKRSLPVKMRMLLWRGIQSVDLHRGHQNRS